MSVGWRVVATLGPNCNSSRRSQTRDTQRARTVPSCWFGGFSLTEVITSNKISRLVNRCTFKSAKRRAFSTSSKTLTTHPTLQVTRLLLLLATLRRPALGDRCSGELDCLRPTAIVSVGASWLKRLCLILLLFSLRSADLAAHGTPEPHLCLHHNTVAKVVCALSCASCLHHNRSCVCSDKSAMVVRPAAVANVPKMGYLPLKIRAMVSHGTLPTRMLRHGRHAPSPLFLSTSCVFSPSSSHVPVLQNKQTWSPK